MADDKDRVISTLNRLIEVCKDGQKGYQTAAECIKNLDLKTLFQSYAHQRERFVNELQSAVRHLGGDPETKGSLAGVLWRGWTNLKALVTGGDEGAVIAECERAEDSARSNYEAALKECLPAEVRVLVERQFSAVKEAHDRIRALEAVVEGTANKGPLPRGGTTP
ncbi:MAG TPA: PA2169 family four-helix-bundle protein [Gemmataceae bacterium]|jgi:uncharacterized protein (TIGR02284 family)|nr:PA2169 family four-helix-bundle protein [Gemmataceae bacterium]